MRIVFKTIIGLLLTMLFFAFFFVILFYKNKGDGDIGLDKQKDMGGLGATIGLLVYIMLLYVLFT